MIATPLSSVGPCAWHRGPPSFRQPSQAHTCVELCYVVASIAPQRPRSFRSNDHRAAISLSLLPSEWHMRQRTRDNTTRVPRERLCKSASAASCSRLCPFCTCRRYRAFALCRLSRSTFSLRLNVAWHPLIAITDTRWQMLLLRDVGLQCGVGNKWRAAPPDRYPSRLILAPLAGLRVCTWGDEERPRSRCPIARQWSLRQMSRRLCAK